ncbi:MAG TPA: cyclopropane-fatty-acyl-phospholipid synthase family protein [Terriglobales bacterium]|nr:cyclopropane-fatty-acyl-phospholipid synthase family protein [Terriglobales bacterium]
MGTLARSFFYDLLVPVSRRYLDELLAGYPRRDFQIRFWNGSLWGTEQHPRFTLVFNRPAALRQFLSSPDELSLGEAYLRDDFDIEGDIEAALDLAHYLVNRHPGASAGPVLVTVFGQPVSRDETGRQPASLAGTPHSRGRDRQAISYHYDLPPDFYALWLDRRMLYSSAYFASPDDDLDAAQERKLEFICRKLRLRPGESLLDIGCGWGGLVMYAAERFGVQAHGITLSVPQAEMARQRIQAAGLQDRCRVEVCDYRDLQGTRYDKIVSVGMVEHVGEAQLPEYFGRTRDLLQPQGVFLNHGIAASATIRRPGRSFSERYVFPDSELVPIHTTLRAAEDSGFEMRDVESLREHYALTLHHWLRRLEAHAAEARHITNDATYRTWRLYMAGAGYGFRTGRFNLYQTLLVKPESGKSGLPLTRDDWYRGPRDKPI